METVFALPGRPTTEPAVINPSNPTPGTEDMTGYLYQAFATDLNDRMRDNGKPDIRSLVQAHDIRLPAIPGFGSPNQTPQPAMEPFKIYEDDRVRVSATLVYHAPVWPAFAFRFDTDDGAVVFSGDTAPSQNLIKMAKGADILVHEVIVSGWIDRLFPSPRSLADEGLRQHLLSAHTAVDQVGKVADHPVVGVVGVEDRRGRCLRHPRGHDRPPGRPPAEPGRDQPLLDGRRAHVRAGGLRARPGPRAARRHRRRQRAPLPRLPGRDPRA